MAQAPLLVLLAAAGAAASLTCEDPALSGLKFCDAALPVAERVAALDGAQKTDVIEMPTMITTGAGKSRLVELVIIEGAYPLYGDFISDPDEALAHRRSGAATLAGFEQLLTGQPALSGAHPGLLDFASLPFVRQFRIADPDWFDAQPWPHLHRWLADFLNSPRFAAIMRKYNPWQEGALGVSFPSGP